MGKEKFAKVEKEYDAGKVEELVSKIDKGSVDVIREDFLDELCINRDKEKRIDDNFLSGDDYTNICSDFIRSLDDSKNEGNILSSLKNKDSVFALQKEIEKLKKKNKTVTKNLKKLKKKENRIKKKLLKKPKKENKRQKKMKIACFSSSANKEGPLSSEQDPMSLICASLTKEMTAYINYINNFQKAALPFFDKVYHKTHDFIKKHFDSDARIIKGGSYNCDLLMPWSNLNISVLLKPKSNFDLGKKSTTKALNNFFSAAKSAKKFIQHATMDETLTLVVVKLNLIPKYKNLVVEIIFKQAIKKTYLENEEIVKEYVKAYPVSKQLYRVFRRFLRFRRLDDPGRAGLNSLSIFLLLIGYLQTLESQFITNWKKTDQTKPEETADTAFKTFLNTPANIGQLFVNFVFFYSYSFDFFRKCVCPFAVKEKRRPAVFAKNTQNQIFALTIINPYNHEIILTKSFKRTGELKEFFKLAYISLFKICNCPSKNKTRVSPKLKLGRRKSGTGEKKGLEVEGFGETKVNMRFSFKQPAKKSVYLGEAELKESLKSKKRGSVYLPLRSKEKEKEEKEMKQEEEEDEKDEIDFCKRGELKKEIKRTSFVVNGFFNYNFHITQIYD